MGGNEIAYAKGVSLDWNCGALAEGLTCYRRAEFFFAHEHWESVWLTLEEPEKSFLQGFERELIRERKPEGIAIAKREGKYSGRKPSLTPTRAAELRRRVALGDSKAALARGIRYIGTSRSKSAGLGSLQNELNAGNRRRETMSESEMQAELERLRAENAQLKSKDKGWSHNGPRRMQPPVKYNF